MTDIELVARAICGTGADALGPHYCDDGRFVEAGKPEWTAWTDEAERVLAALRDARDIADASAELEKIEACEHKWLPAQICDHCLMTKLLATSKRDDAK